MWAWERKRLLTTSNRDYYFRKKNSYKGVMGATRAHTDLHYCKTSVQKSRTDYDAEQAWSFWNLQIHPGAWNSHCQSIAWVLKPSVHSDSCKPCGHCQWNAIVLKPTLPSDSCEPCGHRQSIAGVPKSSVLSDSCKPCDHCQSIAGVLKPSVPLR